MDHLDKTRNERRDFSKGQLTDLSFDDPMKMFSAWYQEAHEKNCADPHAFTLSTVSPEGRPASRIVYMRELIEEGIVLYTNYQSRKGEHIKKNPGVSALFYWDCSERQVRIEGMAEIVPTEMSDAYFASRPRISQIGAWASAQSSRIGSRQELEDLVAKYEKEYPGTVPRPPHWGGILIKPVYFEFWQGRLGRLHDRFCFEWQENGWNIYRISP